MAGPAGLDAPPPELNGKYFEKDFGGTFGKFIGHCLGISRCGESAVGRAMPAAPANRSLLEALIPVQLRCTGHRNGYDDLYRVQYDDGDIEDLQYRDVLRMAKRYPSDETAFLAAQQSRPKPEPTSPPKKCAEEDDEGDEEDDDGVEEEGYEEDDVGARDGAGDDAFVASSKRRGPGRPRKDDSEPRPRGRPRKNVTDGKSPRVRKAVHPPKRRRVAGDGASTSSPNDTPAPVHPAETAWYNGKQFPVRRILDSRKRVVDEFLVQWGVYPVLRVRSSAIPTCRCG